MSVAWSDVSGHVEGYSEFGDEWEAEGAFGSDSDGYNGDSHDSKFAPSCVDKATVAAGAAETGQADAPPGGTETTRFDAESADALEDGTARPASAARDGKPAPAAAVAAGSGQADALLGESAAVRVDAPLTVALGVGTARPGTSVRGMASVPVATTASALGQADTQLDGTASVRLGAPSADAPRGGSACVRDGAPERRCVDSDVIVRLIPTCSPIVVGFNSTLGGNDLSSPFFSAMMHGVSPGGLLPPYSSEHSGAPVSLGRRQVRARDRRERQRANKAGSGSGGQGLAAGPGPGPGQWVSDLEVTGGEADF